MISVCLWRHRRPVVVAPVTFWGLQALPMGESLQPSYSHFTLAPLCFSCAAMRKLTLFCSTLTLWLRSRLIAAAVVIEPLKMRSHWKRGRLLPRS